MDVDEGATGEELVGDLLVLAIAGGQLLGTMRRQLRPRTSRWRLVTPP